ncbi:MAG: Gx transporter family protein [Clostridia bacterium]|nr:Gx transporter family protein [Clostridia bacterium]
MMKTARIAYIALLGALSIVFGYIESLFPIPIAIPGIKLGISNIVVLFALIKMNKSDAFFVLIIKVLVCSLLFSGINSLFYSFLGGLFSFFAMIFALKSGFSTIGASMAGGVFHNIGQILAASIMLLSPAPLYHLPVLLLSGLIVGGIVGVLCKTVMSHLK